MIYQTSDKVESTYIYRNIKVQEDIITRLDPTSRSDARKPLRSSKHYIQYQEMKICSKNCLNGFLFDVEKTMLTRQMHDMIGK